VKDDVICVARHRQVGHETIGLREQLSIGTTYGSWFKVKGSRSLDEPSYKDGRISRGCPQVPAELCVGRSEKFGRFLKFFLRKANKFERRV